MVVILGLAKKERIPKRIFYPDKSEIMETNPKYISPYIIGNDEILPIVKETSEMLNGLPEIIMGSQAIDNGQYIFTHDQKNEFLSLEPKAEQYLKPFVNAKEFLNNDNRWILILQKIKPSELKNLPETKKRIAAVKKFRSASKRKSTQKLSETPRLFQLNVIPSKEFLLIPRHTSERREYIPMGYLEPPIVPSDATLIIENPSLGLLGILSSKMHMIWIRTIGGKLETRMRYSAGVVYKTFPIPAENFDKVEKEMQSILDIRKENSDSTLAELYDPELMPSDLKKAHLKLDLAVEKLYRKKPFESDDERINFLLTRYKEMIDTNS